MSQVEEGQVNHECKDNDDNVAMAAASLNPRMSWGENMRDVLLRTLDHPVVQAAGIAVLVLVIIDGAFFFFLLVGWQSMCRPRTDCEPRNWWYNFSVQMLTALFTYMSTASMPWRSTHFLHTMGWGCPYRENAPGHDLYGRWNENDSWFHIPLKRRRGIIILLLLNCLAQYANQATRIKYYTFELQNEFPGNFWTNIFFVSSFVCAAIAGGWMAYEIALLRKANPGRFGPGPVEMMQAFCSEHGSAFNGESKKTDLTLHDENNASDQNEKCEAERVDPLSVLDPTCDRQGRCLLPAQRSSMRMWAM